MYKNNISVYSSVLSFITTFQLIKSPKYTQLFKIMHSMGLYDNHCILELLGHELRASMIINALKTLFFLFVYSSFIS
jgi:hypothetical protein